MRLNCSSHGSPACKEVRNIWLKMPLIEIKHMHATLINAFTIRHYSLYIHIRKRACFTKRNTSSNQNKNTFRHNNKTTKRKKEIIHIWLPDSPKQHAGWLPMRQYHVIETFYIRNSICRAYTC